MMNRLIQCPSLKNSWPKQKCSEGHLVPSPTPNSWLKEERWRNLQWPTRLSSREMHSSCLWITRKQSTATPGAFLTSRSQTTHCLALSIPTGRSAISSCISMSRLLQTLMKQLSLIRTTWNQSRDAAPLPTTPTDCDRPDEISLILCLLSTAKHLKITSIKLIKGSKRPKQKACKSCEDKFSSMPALTSTERAETVKTCTRMNLNAWDAKNLKGKQTKS